ncbi:MAG: hypothetical protein M1823_003274 [Watsoniomyces obsoletus]|nr:MAG: hypothetical protein M1823_003274 [Watsoniomyces obsoletus]
MTARIEAVNLDEQAVKHELTVEEVSGKESDGLPDEDIVRPDSYEDADSSPDENDGSGAHHLVENSEDIEYSSETLSTTDSQGPGEGQPHHGRRRAREHGRRSSLLKRRHEKSHAWKQRMQTFHQSMRHSTAHAGSWPPVPPPPSSAAGQLPDDGFVANTSSLRNDEDQDNIEQLPVDDPMDLD